jgi:hypothetical protein
MIDAVEHCRFAPTGVDPRRRPVRHADGGRYHLGVTQARLVGSATEAIGLA